MVNFDRMTVQVWYTIYQIFIMLPLLLIYMHRRKRGKEQAFDFRWSIVGLAVFLAGRLFVLFSPEQAGSIDFGDFAHTPFQGC